MYIRLALVSTLSIIAFACNTKPSDADLKAQDIIRFGPMEHFNSYYIYQKSLGLEDVRFSQDSFQLRVWYSLADSADVFVVKQANNGAWSSARIRFPLKSDSVRMHYRKCTSENGQQIWESLRQAGIKEFHGMDTITLGRYGDGEIAIIQIATPSSYQTYISQVGFGWHSENDAPEVKEATRFVTLLFSEMNCIK